ncbi:ABC transporter permease [Prolixibacter bellariivorans]|uniref:ABC transporter permease n=1 Tax=Prolixibacter bellariivorans TaxID=314319 RepID=A0A5M4AZ58_9BACT|nr:ABC transporter permease [Prolixibacter bellariivorans]GET32697.1 ABC transporter permease [Prolixibacter bellariivorans]
MLRNYLLAAIRHLLKNKLFTAINVLGLAIGMAVSLLILNYVNFEFSYDNMHHLAKRIYRVESRFFEGNTLTDDWPTSSFGYAPAMMQHISGIQDAVRVDIHETEQIVSYENIRFRESDVAVTEPSFFRIFDFPLLEGDPKTALEGPNKVVITQTAAHRYFGETDPIGKILKFSTTGSVKNCEVTGVIADLPPNSHFHFDFFISWKTLPDWMNNFWYLHEVYTYVLLQPNVSPASIENAFPKMAEQYKTAAALKNKTWAIHLNPLRNIHLTPQKQYERETKGNRNAVNALMLVALAILVIAWFNYINLTTARALDRAREVSVRKVSGASKIHIIIQFLMESLLVNGVALVLAIGVMLVSVGGFNQLTGKNIPFQLWKDSTFWIPIVLVFLSGIFISGFYPASVLASIKPISILRGKSKQSKGTGSMRKGLVVVQFVASFVLIFSTIVVYNQLDYMMNQPTGVNINRVMAIKFPAQTDELQQKIISFRRELKGFTDVKNAAISSAVPGMEVAFFASNHRADDPNKQNRLYEMLSADDNFASTYGMKIIAGRGFSEDFGDDRNKLVVNEEALKLLDLPDNEESIGRRISVEGEEEPFEIIGIMKNYHQQSLVKAYTPIMMIKYDRIPWISPRFISVKMTGNPSAKTMANIRNLWERFFPQSTFDYFFVDQFYQQQYKSDQRFGSVFGFFSALAVFIACLGLWALAMYSGVTRRKEIGVRKVNGASVGSIMSMLNADILKWVISAFIIGVPLSWYLMHKWLENFAWKTALSWWIFASAALFTLVIAIAAVSWQSYKAANRNPVEVLKDE